MVKKVIAVVGKGVYMLAILLVEMMWYKEDRTPNGAVLRRSYYHPVKIEEEVDLSGKGVFYKQCYYQQQGTTVFSNGDIFEKKSIEQKKKKCQTPFMQKHEREERSAARWSRRVQKERGSFYSIEEIKFPYLTISEEENESYRIKWYDNGIGMPRRRGGNEDLYIKGAKLAGQANILNETAFLLAEGEAGVLKYNCRCTSFEGQWYQCYYVYMVNEKQLTHDIFLRDYDYEYSQLADLF